MINISRRRTLKQILGAASFSTLPSLLPDNDTLLSKLDDHWEGNPLGIALVGLGNYSHAALKPALRLTTKAKLKGIVTGTPTKAAEWSKTFGLPTTHVYDYNTFDQIADNKDIDIVYIVLPNFMHAEYTIRALEAGKHVICEKPMAMNVAECKQMIAASKQANRKLSIGYRLHYEKHHQEAMRLGRDQPFGRINFIESSFAYHLSDPGLWRLSKEKGGGGAIMDLGVYPIQACRYITGEEPSAVTAQAFVRDRSRFKDIYESFFWQFEFPSGIIANCSTSYSSYVDRLYVSCYDGWFRLHPSFNGRGTLGESSNGAMNLKKVNQQAVHMDDFAKSILEDSPLRVEATQGLQDLRIIEAIMQSAEQGVRLAIPNL